MINFNFLRLKMCLFCNIINRTIPAEILAKTEDVTVIRDIDKLSNHSLALPNRHIENIRSLTKSDIGTLQQMEKYRNVFSSSFYIKKLGSLKKKNFLFEINKYKTWKVVKFLFKIWKVKWMSQK